MILFPRKIEPDKVKKLCGFGFLRLIANVVFFAKTMAVAGAKRVQRWAMEHTKNRQTTHIGT